MQTAVGIPLNYDVKSNYPGRFSFKTNILRSLQRNVMISGRRGHFHLQIHMSAVEFVYHTGDSFDSFINISCLCCFKLVQ